MSKELEALKSLRCAVSLGLGTAYEEMNNKCDIIEAALKRLEKIETTTHSVLREDISKKLKAIETIKKHTNKDGIHIDFNEVMRASVKNFDYTTMTYIVDEELIKEYDLLKEVFK